MASLRNLNGIWPAAMSGQWRRSLCIGGVSIQCESWRIWRGGVNEMAAGSWRRGARLFQRNRRHVVTRRKSGGGESSAASGDQLAKTRWRNHLTWPQYNQRLMLQFIVAANVS
jgi:hypothetical protein